MEEDVIPVVPQEGAIEEEVEVVLPSDTEAFEMPEKFSGMSAEDIVKSYMAEAAAAAEVEPPKEINEEVTESDATTTADLIDEYTSRGTELTEEDYAVLQEKGYSKKQVDIYKAGVQAQSAQQAGLTMEKAGTTPEEATNAATWARENWSEDRVTQFNAAIVDAPEGVQVQMLQMLTEQYRSVNKVPSPLDPIHSTSKPTPKAEGYSSMEQLIADQSDARYDQRSFAFDPAYYKAVRTKAGKSTF